MDCRIVHVWFMGLTVTLAGCLPGFKSTGSNTETVQLNGAPPPGVEIQKETPGPKTRPVPVAVAFAALKESEGDKSNDVEVQVKLRDLARQAYQEALQIDPKHLPAHLGVGRIHSKLGNHDKAIESLQKSIQQFPKESILWHELAMCHNRRKNHQEAVDCLNKAVAMDPENRIYPQTLGYTLARAGRVEESLQVLSRLYGPAQAHFTVARMMFHMNQIPQCRRHLQEAVRLEPTFEKAQQFLAGLNQPDQLPPANAQASVDLQFKAE